MDLNTFTERSRGFIQAAQTIAQREDHQRLLPEHILKALMDDDQGLASNLITRAGGAPQRVVEAVDALLPRSPKSAGTRGKPIWIVKRAKCLPRRKSWRRKRAIVSFLSNVSCRLCPW